MNLEQTIANGQVAWTLLIIVFLLFMIAVKVWKPDSTTKKKNSSRLK